MQESITMTLQQVYEAMRAAGIKTSKQVISNGIATGAYPFGRVVSIGQTGRRTIEIYRVDFDSWLKSKTTTANAQPTYPAPIPIRKIS